jgi:hypothetical protein
MTSVQRYGLLILLLVLTACAPISIATPTTSAPTPIPDTQPALVEAGPAQRVELTAGRYQLIMFYSPL